MENQTFKASADFIAVHLEVKKQYKDKYPQTITPYIKILSQVMDAQGIKAEQALKQISDSRLVQPEQTKDRDKQDLADAYAYQKQRLFVSATMCILENNSQPH